MTDFKQMNLSNARFEDVYLTEARFHDVDLANARFRLVNLSGVSIRGALLRNVEINGEIDDLRVNGIDIVPLVEAELDRRYPERPKMRPVDADGFREAWGILERLWDGTVDRARRLDAKLLHERVDDEWSFIETLRHLVFATDTWVSLAIKAEPSPWHPLHLPHDDMPDDPSVPRDRDVQPSLDEVLSVRSGRMAKVRDLLADLTDQDLSRPTGPVRGPGWPEPEGFTVQECLEVVLHEEWEHRLYAERDLAALETRTN